MSVNGIGNLFGRALDGLRVSSSGMNVASNNIANVNTQGYNRQLFIQGTRAFDSGGFMGGGVTDLGVTSFMDPFIERQLASEFSDLGKFDSRRLTLMNLENTVYQGADQGLGVAINKFFNAWSELAGDPANGALREQVRSSGRNLAEYFNSTHSSVQSLRQNLSGTIGSQVSNVNSLSSQIAQLNDAIRGASDQTAILELKAERQLTVNKLSEEIGINYFEAADQTLTVQLQGTGVPLVRSNASATLTVSDDLSSGGTLAINSTIAGGGPGTLDVTAYINNGKLGGSLIDRNTTLNNVLSDLNDLAYQVSNDVNTLHYNGFGLDGNDQRNFFTPLASADNAASLIAVDASILNNLDALAAAQEDPSVSGVGDGRVANALVALQNALSMDGSSKTYSQFFSSVVSDVGVQAGNVEQSYMAQAKLVNKLQEQRENVSGVNLDEEAADIIKYQRAFEGSARIMKVANEMLDTLLGL